MIDIDDKLDEKLRQQRDGQLEEDEELQLRFIAKSYAICENSIAVLSNLRTNKSHIYYGMTSDFLGFEPSGSYEKIESIWEEKILNRIHPDDQRRRNLQELVYYQFVSASHSDKAFYWYLENTMRMADKDGKYLPTRHRIFYFKGKGQRDDNGLRDQPDDFLLSFSGHLRSGGVGVCRGWKTCFTGQAHL